MELGQRHMPGHRWWQPDLLIAKQVLRRAIRQNISATASQLAYHFTFSFFPTLMILAYVLTTIEAPFLFARLMLALQTLLPPSAITLVDQVLSEVRRGSGWHILLSGLLLSLSSAVSGLQVLICAINHAYGVDDDRPYWKRSLLALLMTLLLALLLCIALVLVIWGNWLGVHLMGWLGLKTWFATIWGLLRWPAILLTVVGGLLVLYTAAPKLPVSVWRALPGAVFGGGGWVVATWIFGWYIKNIASYNRVYGSIGGMIVLMVWLYVTGVIILLGAELNGALYRRRHGF
ncbi:MAG TPA: YihY/virulence factor BrkB family protein [Herpetosiphonaceae bacterium]|nr:YihY/virulence factor BrkB family protein [Herpetosiphonaceae bacterium]